MKSAKQGIQQGLEWNDFFGHNVAFNYNNKKEKHTTWCGGFVSLGIKIYVIIYVTILLQRMYNLEENGNRIKTMQFYEDASQTNKKHHIDPKDMMFSLSILDT